MWIPLLFLFVITFTNPTLVASTTQSPDLIFGLTISLTFTCPHTIQHITDTEALTIKNILHDIITDQIETIFDSNTITNCIQHPQDLITLQSTTATAQVIVRATITACNEEIEDQLFVLYSSNNTLSDEFIDTVQSQTSFTIIGDLLIDIDTIDAYEAYGTTDMDSMDANEEEINKIWLLNVVYIGTAFVATCIVFIILFMYCIHRRKEKKEHKNAEEELGDNIQAPGLSRMVSLSSSPGSPKSPPLSSADQFHHTVSQHYLVYGTEDITTLTPSPNPIKGQNDVDFVERAIKINKRILKPLPKNQRVDAEAVEVHLPRIRFEDLDVGVDDDDADPELSYSP
eukprot:168033_1